MTYVAAAAVLDPVTHCAWPGIEPLSPQRPKPGWIFNPLPLCHSENPEAHLSADQSSLVPTFIWAQALLLPLIHRDEGQEAGLETTAMV